jgi:hypothetical protein
MKFFRHDRDELHYPSLLSAVVSHQSESKTKNITPRYFYYNNINHHWIDPLILSQRTPGLKISYLQGERSTNNSAYHVRLKSIRTNSSDNSNSLTCFP